jgi:hypothetical protein
MNISDLSNKNYNFNITKITKSNLLFFTKLLNNKLKKNILFVFSKKLKQKDQFFLNTLSKRDFLVIPKWSDGLITNYHQMSKSYKNKLSYNFITNNINFDDIDFIILNFIPEKQSSIYNELMILKTSLNIQLVCCMNINSATTNLKDSIIDIPLFYTEQENNTFYPSLSFLQFYLLNYLLLK